MAIFLCISQGEILIAKWSHDPRGKCYGPSTASPRHQLPRLDDIFEDQTILSLGYRRNDDKQKRTETKI